MLVSLEKEWTNGNWDTYSVQLSASESLVTAMEAQLSATVHVIKPTNNVNNKLRKKCYIIKQWSSEKLLIYTQKTINIFK